MTVWNYCHVITPTCASMRDWNFVQNQEKDELATKTICWCGEQFVHQLQSHYWLNSLQKGHTSPQRTCLWWDVAEFLNLLAACFRQWVSKWYVVNLIFYALKQIKIVNKWFLKIVGRKNKTRRQPRLRKSDTDILLTKYNNPTSAPVSHSKLTSR